MERGRPLASTRGRCWASAPTETPEGLQQRELPGAGQELQRGWLWQGAGGFPPQARAVGRLTEQVAPGTPPLQRLWKLAAEQSRAEPAAAQIAGGKKNAPARNKGGWLLSCSRNSFLEKNPASGSASAADWQQGLGKALKLPCLLSPPLCPWPTGGSPHLGGTAGSCLSWWQPASAAPDPVPLLTQLS